MPDAALGIQSIFIAEIFRRNDRLVPAIPTSVQESSGNPPRSSTHVLWFQLKRIYLIPPLLRSSANSIKIDNLCCTIVTKFLRPAVITIKYHF
jgi:hypothetical protein